ncbi:unnamed protein product [Arctogadus glacialis]
MLNRNLTCRNITNRPSHLEDPEPCSTAVRHASAPWRTQSPVLLRFDTSQGRVIWRTQSPVLPRFDTSQPPGGPRALFYRGLTRLRTMPPPPSGTKAVHTSTHSGGRWPRGLTGGRRLPQMVPWFFFHLVLLWRNVRAPHGRSVWGGSPGGPQCMGGVTRRTPVYGGVTRQTPVYERLPSAA